MPKFQMYMARRATCHSSRCDIHNPFGQGGREQTDHHHQRHQKRGRQPQARTRIMRGMGVAFPLWSQEHMRDVSKAVSG